MSFRQMTYLNKLLVYGFLLGVVPLAILGFLSYFRASTTIQKYVEAGNLQILKHSQLAVEQNMKTVETALVAFLNSPQGTDLYNIPLDYNKYGPFSELESSMRQLQIYETGVFDVTLYNMQYLWRVNNAGIATFDNKEEELQPYENFLKSSMNSTWIKNEHGIRFLKKSPLYVANPAMLVVVDIPYSHLSKLLLQANPLGSTAILDSHMELLLGQDQGSVQQLLGHAELEKKLSGDAPEGKLVVKRGGESYGVTYVHSAFSGWYYVAAASIDEITKESRSIGQFTWWISAGILFLILFAAWFGSNNMYRPIRMLHSALVGSGDKSGDPGDRKEDHIQQIGQHVTKLLDREKRMSSQIEGYTAQLEAFFVQKLILGDVRKREIDEKLDMFGYAAGWRQMTVMAVEIDTLEGTRYSRNDQDLLLFAISNMVSEIVPQTNRLAPIVSGSSQLNVLGTVQDDPEAWSAELQRWAEAIQKAASNYLDVTVSVALSKPAAQWTDVPRAYKEAEEALNYRVRLGNEAIIYSEDVVSGPAETVHYPLKLEQELLASIKSGYRLQAEEKLRHFMQELVRPPFHFQEYQLSVFRLLTEITGLLQAEGVPFSELAVGEAPLIEQMSQLRTVEEMEAWFLQKLIAPVITVLEERRSSQFQNISDAVIQMIHEEFDTLLTLELCASRIHYHPHYVSKVFRQETGVNFSEYLLKHRLEMAKGWLTETGMTVTEIAEKLKYTSPTNFIRYFRKIEGITPGQYRERNAGSISIIE
ncbi:helix-turn-helix domain-containing protein [Cohnella hashimotonis]|uniref:Helix-turn-helix domain-containing protein n=1 Tax=Cohnella hashimotonis TaxID=2826895 RepID=A0ABT6THM9_9BACL|nr:helix-turn-helix domain-containing protein [Cohnella hashimotonis]MDI4646348.1 helix-turn-helix domain-containing protein [Cohnella hashimotonis]